MMMILRLLLTALSAALALAPAAHAAPGNADPGGSGCDPSDPAVCMLPFPSDFFTRADGSTPTGRRLSFETTAMPRNRAGKPIDAADYNFSDGFSPGSSIITRVPGLDSLEAFRASELPPIDDPARSLAADSPVVVLDATTGERQLVWAEIDSNPLLADPARPQDVNLIIRPAKNFAEGHRIIVALRGLRTADGEPITAGEEFAKLREGARQGKGNGVEYGGARGRHIRQNVLAPLAAHGVEANELFLAWDFTVASAKSTTGRMLSIRDRAFAELGDTDLADLRVSGRAPQFAINPDDPLDRSETAGVDGIREFKPCSAGATPACEAGESQWTGRRVRGTFTVPCFLDAPGCPTGSKFVLGPDGNPVRIPGNTTVQTFTCQIPHSAIRNPGVARAGIYGHGLFGTQSEAAQNQLQYLSDEHGFVFCATDWKGMSTYDVPNAATILQDLSRFNTLVDHTEQGFLGMLFLGRLMIHPDGLSANPAFRVGTTPVFDSSNLFYDGNSQGGIYGGSLTAIAPDFQRAVLGVPGMNYSTLLTRSVDFDMYAEGTVGGVDGPYGMYDNYPSLLERPLILAIIQTLWDRADPNGYAAHMTSDPLPNTPPHEVLLHVGFGDHQVADVTTEVTARTIGAAVHRPVLEDGRARYSGRPYPDAAVPEPWQGIPAVPYDALTGTWDGSAVMVWDVGASRNPAPPAANIPPREGRDPHEDPRRTFIAIEQKSAFLRKDGVVKDVCGGPCYTRGYRGVTGL